MKNNFNFFQNRLSSRTFFVLVIGCILIQIIALFLFYVYLAVGYFRMNQKQLISRLQHTISLANHLPANDLPLVLHSVNRIGFHATVTKRQPHKVFLLPSHSKRWVKHFVKQHPRGFRAAFAISDQRWLVIRAKLMTHNTFVAATLLAILLLFISLILLCIWAIKRLETPLGLLAKAVRRFGLDVQAPPLAETGSKDMQNVAQAFNEMQGQIRRLLTDRTEMLAAISHDLRTPITRLQLRIESMQGSKHYEKALADLHEMEQMIASILSFSRDYVRTESIQSFDLNALLGSICNDLTDTGQPANYLDDAHRVPFNGRLSALKRALNNLVENAIKYGKQADVELKTTDNQIHIKVNDLGPGIPDHEHDNVFKPFYRVDPARSPDISGSGLGMAVARDIIRAHGGEITLINRKPKGLTVLVTLPNKPLEST